MGKHIMGLIRFDYRLRINFTLRVSPMSYFDPLAEKEDVTG